MLINQKKKITIVALAFIMLGVLVFWKTSDIKIHGGISAWDMLTARLVPSTQYPTPGVPRPIPSNLPPAFTPYPTPRFGATWGQRLRPNGADFDYTQWKTLRNDEYGFEVKYPSDWTYKADKMKNQPGALPFAYTIFIFSNEKSSGQLRLMVKKESQEEYEKSRSESELGGRIVKEDVSINGAKWIMINPDLTTFDTGGLILPVSVEILRQGYLFLFGDVSTTRDLDTISHIVKSFQFIK